MAGHVRTLEAEKAAAILEAALAGQVRGIGDLTVADAAAKGGIALREAELGLHFLSNKYRGTLSTTEKGELLFRFPYGFSLPFTKRPGVIKFWEKLKRGVLGAAKLVVRAWISIVLIGYVAVFVAIALAMLFGSQNNNSRSSSRGGDLAIGLLRVVSEALFWTFHPFSPFYAGEYYARTGQRRREAKAPFYERVNRFVFGPEPKKMDAREIERRILTSIRAHAGRIGIGDVMRITGLPREEADPLMARLMLDYEGEVEVSDDGGIFYKFPALRRTAQQTAFERPPPPVWTERVEAAPTTGNDSGSDLLIAALNGFNLFMSFVAMQAGLTISHLTDLISAYQAHLPLDVVPPADGVPLVLGVIPLLFSSALFALPLLRWATKKRREKKAEQENARRAVLKTVLDNTQSSAPITEKDLAKAWKDATGSEPSSKDITKEVVQLGGDFDVDRAQYKFRDLEAEVAALKKEREHASEDEKDVGVVVFRAN